MSLLDELFGQILQSEETIKQRFDQLKDGKRVSSLQGGSLINEELSQMSFNAAAKLV